VGGIGKFSAYRSDYKITDAAGAPLVLTPGFTIGLPIGSGEHKDADNPDSGDGSHGQSQEAIQDTYPLCRVHLYLNPGTYAAMARLEVSNSSSGLDVSFGNFSTSSDIGFDKDGCDPSFAGTIAGAILGGILAGPGGAALGGVAGHIAGNRLEDKVNAKIEAGIINKLHGLNLAWHFTL
jgi:hypothetical protein